MGNKIEHPSVELPPEKLVMVTGGNTGIGYETAKSIAKMGARVCITSRSEDKAKAAIERMQTEHRAEMQQKSHGQASSPSTSEEVDQIKPLNVEYIKVDLASLQSTMDFIQKTKERMQYLNILVCNAGIAFVKQEYTEDKYESQFQVNYLSHLLIVLHLMPLLRAGAPDSRIVLLSSDAHKGGKLDLDNMQGHKSFSRLTAYASSKAYMVMAAHFLARRLEGTGVSTFSIDPGFVDTNIMNNFSDLKLMSFFAGAYKKFGMMRTPKQGAATSVVACVDPSLRGKTAVFMKNCRPANPATFCWDGKNQEDLWSYSLGCLNQFISDDVLKEAFPSARPDLLIIPKDATRTVEEKVVDDPGKRDGRSDDKQMGDQSKAGKASLERKQDEEQPEIESSPGAAEEASEKPKAPQDSSASSAEDKMPEVAPRDDEKECETSHDKKQIEEHLEEKESSFAEVPTKEVKTEETSRQESEESMLKDSPPEQIEGEPSKESSAGTPETGQTSEDPKADAEVPSESLKTSKEPQAKEIDDASKEGTAGAASAEIKQMEGQPEREPSAEAAPEIEQTAESPKADAEVPTEGLQTSREPSGQKSEERGVTDDAANEETAVAASSDSKQVEEQPDEEASARAGSEIDQTSEDLKADAEVPAESHQTSKEPSGRKSEERGVTDDAANEETAVAASLTEQVEEQPDEEASARAGSEMNQTSEDLKAAAEVPAESLQTSREPSGRKSEERGMTDAAANEETAVAASSDKQVEEQLDKEASARAGSEIDQTSEDLKPDGEAPTESLETAIKKPSDQESEERDVKDDASTACAASMEDQPEGEPLAEATPEIDETSTEPKAENKDTADEVLEFKEDVSQLATKEVQLAPETSTGGEDLSDGQEKERHTVDTAAAEDSSGMPDADMPTEKAEEGSTQVPTGTSEEDVSIKVEDGEGKPTEGQASQQ